MKTNKIMNCILGVLFGIISCGCFNNKSGIQAENVNDNDVYSTEIVVTEDIKSEQSADAQGRLVVENNVNVFGDVRTTAASGKAVPPARRPYVVREDSDNDDNSDPVLIFSDFESEPIKDFEEVEAVIEISYQDVLQYETGSADYAREDQGVYDYFGENETADKKSSLDGLGFAAGVHVGVDVGGAVPWPPSNMRGDAMKMSAVPKLNPSLGFSFTAYFPKNWSVTAEATFKQVGIDATAWVSGQEFRMPEDNSVVRFRGTANVVMDFSMLEIPVYIGYSFGEGRNRVFLGGYYSYIFKGDFNTTPIKGMVQNPNDPNETPILVTPDNPVPSDVMPVFNDYLGRWDAGMLLGYECQIIPKLNLSVRLSMGFKDIFRKGSNYLEYKMLHMRGSVTLSYSVFRHNYSTYRR